MLFNFADENLNGFELAFLQSEEYADQIIKEFKNTYIEGENPNELLSSIAGRLDIHNGDLFPDSKTRIEREVSNYLMRY